MKILETKNFVCIDDPSAVTHLTVSGKLTKELPSLLVRKSLALACLPGGGNMAPVKNDKRDGLVGQTTGIHRLDLPLASRRWDGRLSLGGATVIFQETIPHLPRLGQRQDVVRRPVLAVVGDGLGAGGTPADLGVPAQRGHGPDLFPERAGERVGHCGAVGEAGGEAEVLVDAEV